MKLRESIYFATKRANSLHFCILLLTSILIIYVLLRVKLLVKKYEPRFIFAFWLAWVDEAMGTYTVNFAFNESVCLLSWRYCYVWSAEKPLPGVNQSRKYLRTFLCHRLFVLFFLPHFSPKKICINRFLCLLALTARWGVALQSEKSDLRFILRCPQQLIN